MNSFTFVDCTTVNEALDHLKGDAVAKAGGIDLLDLMKDGVLTPPTLVNIRQVKSLHGIETTSQGLSIGPLTTLAQIAGHPVIQKQYTALSDAAGHAATPQVRNMATVGGNLVQKQRCWYYRSAEFNCLRKGGDTCYAQKGENQYHAVMNNDICAMVSPSSTAVPLMALGALVEITSQKGKRTVPLNEFYFKPEDNLLQETVVSPDELITRILVPAPRPGTRSAYQKYGEKESFDWPLADAGVVLVMDGDTCSSASIVLGAAAPTPIHATAAEALLRGKTLDEATARAAGAAAMKGATPLAQNGYKVQLLSTVIYRTILVAAGQMKSDPSAVGGMA
jgi:xanthine dehydrogenase YagS FAD-binding subunit